ncbi:MAG: N-acetylneuraminic acid mutarotase [Bradymonadia bacterium]|jgi:N-acetylneuraminic acid mutarotase
MTASLRTLCLLATLLLTAAACSSEPGGGTDSDAPSDAGDTPDGSGMIDDIEEDSGAGGVCDPTPERCDSADDSLAPPRLSEFSLAYHEGSQSMIAFGGSTAVPPRCERPLSQFIGETWVFDDVCGTWSNPQPAVAPSARTRHSAVTVGHSMYMFGGRWRADGSAEGDYTMYAELWRFDMNDETWTLVDDGGGPAARVDFAMVASADTLYIFGGNTSEIGVRFTPQNDVWAFDTTTETWSQGSSAGAPSQRLYVTGAWDSQREQAVFFGGGDETAFFDDAVYFNELHSYHPATDSWQLVANGVGAPETRFWAKMTYDSSFDSYVIFGGHDSTNLGNRNDVWEFRNESSSWGPLATGDTFNNPATGTCDFPIDFVNVDRALPERRSAHGMVWSETCGHALVFGGKTDCGAINDVWRLVDGTFAEAREGTSGEVCARFRDNIDNCANLCF